MKSELLIGLIGDENQQVTAHRAIPLALQIAANVIGVTLKHQWIPTPQASSKLKGTGHQPFDGLWCVPASPYEDTNSVLSALSIARKENIPTLGTCGGFQHMAIEYAQNGLGHANADNAETNPNADMPLIAPLACSLVEVTGHVSFKAGSLIAKHYQAISTEEKYHCNFGLNSQYSKIFLESDITISGADENHEPRAIEHTRHPFYIGVAYQPERSALEQKSHPLISAFVKAAVTPKP